MTDLPSGENKAQNTCWERSVSFPKNLLISLLSERLHKRTVVSIPPERTCLPSGEKDAVITRSVCPSKLPRRFGGGLVKKKKTRGKIIPIAKTPQYIFFKTALGFLRVPITKDGI